MVRPELERFIVALSGFKHKKQFIYNRAQDGQGFPLPLTEAQLDELERAAQDVQGRLKALLAAE